MFLRRLSGLERRWLPTLRTQSEGESLPAFLPRGSLVSVGGHSLTPELHLCRFLPLLGVIFGDRVRKTWGKAGLKCDSPIKTWPPQRVAQGAPGATPVSILLSLHSHFCPRPQVCWMVGPKIWSGAHASVQSEFVLGTGDA